MWQQMSKKNKNGVVTSLLVRIKQIRFVAACLVLQKCFSLSRHASEYLQSEETNLSPAAVENVTAKF